MSKIFQIKANGVKAQPQTSAPELKNVQDILATIDRELDKVASGMLTVKGTDGSMMIFRNASVLLALTSGEEFNDDLRKRLMVIIAHLKRFQLENPDTKQYFTTDGVIYLLENILEQSIKEKTDN